MEKTMKNQMIKKLFTGTEIFALILLVFGVGSSAVNITNKKRLDRLGQENVEQATQIKELVGKVEEVNKKKDDIVEKKDIIEKELKKKASEGFSILYEQAVDVDKENATDMTSTHLYTAKEYVKVWGYEAMAQLIKWQQGMIDKQLADTRKLMQEKKQLEQEYQTYRIKTQEEILKTKDESIKHEENARNLQNKLSTFLAENSWLSNLMFWGCIIGGVYVFFSFGGIGLLFKSRSNAIQAAQHYRRKKNAAVQAIKTFTLVNDDGNETMERIINSGDDIEIEEDDERIPVSKSFQMKKKNP